MKGVYREKTLVSKNVRFITVNGRRIPLRLPYPGKNAIHRAVIDAQSIGALSSLYNSHYAIEPVAISTVHAREGGFKYTEGLYNKYKKNKSVTPPVIYRASGKNVVAEGHHRVGSAQAAGHQAMWALVTPPRRRY
jgi:hypothetical protein